MIQTYDRTTWLPIKTTWIRWSLFVDWFNDQNEAVTWPETVGDILDHMFWWDDAIMVCLRRIGLEWTTDGIRVHHQTIDDATTFLAMLAGDENEDDPKTAALQAAMDIGGDESRDHVDSLSTILETVADYMKGNRIA